MDECVFCKIVQKQVPARIVYEDNEFLALLDINPLNPGHTLVIPRHHYRWTFDIPNFGYYWEVAKKIAIAALKSLGATTVNFLTMGFQVQHAHIHVVPRFENDGHGEVPNRATAKKIDEQRMNEIFEKMKREISNLSRPKVEETAEKEEEEKPKKEPKKRSEDEVYWMKRRMRIG